MPYTAKDYSKLIGIKGFSDTLLNNHFSLYQGYVKNTNVLLDALTQMAKKGFAANPEYAELKRRLGWEFNGMRLHELYFDNLAPNAGRTKNGALERKLEENFGSAVEWEKDYRSTGSLRGIGWAILYQDSTSGRLVNTWINEHDAGHLAGCNPILIMDVFEHAFITDYGLKKADYIDAFLMNVNWRIVEMRFSAYTDVMKKAG